MSQINTTLSRSTTQNISLNETAVRNLAGIASGTISMSNFYGKRLAVSVSNTFDVPNSLYVPGDVITFSAGTGTTTFPVRNGKVFRISMWGAGGGSTGNPGGVGGNANGGIIVADINLSAYANSNLFFVRGGGGINSTTGIDGSCSSVYAGGSNGGGNGAGTRGAGGGGRTDLRTVSGTTTSELLVAGGGGGNSGTLGTTGTRFQGSAGCTGLFGSWCGDNGGGGGGYFGGASSCSDDGSNAGAGSNFITTAVSTTTITNTRISGTSGGNSGNGRFTVQVISI